MFETQVQDRITLSQILEQVQAINQRIDTIEWYAVKATMPF
ncbi:hypothetical protein FNYG_05374 [Fusarium nygamai]|uniref:Uncharacterized protein n=1 Tax=Gibberella nygamai TaxID=42673 RepID=A0A2K0WGC9_GIBNY|nr:hypothetical protein FNYG_05374 [Fusarium nygamai]